MVSCVFQGAFDNGFYEDNHTKFGKYGESMGFYDEPLPVKDVDYKALVRLVFLRMRAWPQALK